METIVASLAAVTWTEWVAVVLALAYLLLAIRQNPWCWAFGIASSAMYCVIFARTGLVMQAALQVFFVAMAVYGWRVWKGGATAAPAPVRRWPVRWHALALGGVALATLVNGRIVADPAAGPLVPYADASIAWGSVLTTWLVARKVLENWLYWIVIDVAAALLYGSQGLHATAVLYLLYAGLAVRGFQAWQKDARGRVAVAA
ncbi:MAG TPA: nicotinamide riboside transporter PnuC [Steroidobacteraceae bacterium]|nr:nicotinamide riboside transporter PnuC [Steroidobacteraceae bacterium]